MQWECPPALETVFHGEMNFQRRARVGFLGLCSSVRMLLFRSMVWSSFLNKKYISLGIYVKKTKSLIQKDIYTTVFIEASFIIVSIIVNYQPLFTIAKIWKQRRYPSKDEWIKKCATCIQ